MAPLEPVGILGLAEIRGSRMRNDIPEILAQKTAACPDPEDFEEKLPGDIDTVPASVNVYVLVCAERSKQAIAHCIQGKVSPKNQF